MICLSVDPAFAVEFPKHKHHDLEDWQRAYRIKNAIAIKSFKPKLLHYPATWGVPDSSLEFAVAL